MEVTHEAHTVISIPFLNEILTDFHYSVPEAIVLRSGISSLVFGDGLIYFLVTFAVNLTATVSVDVRLIIS